MACVSSTMSVQVDRVMIRVPLRAVTDKQDSWLGQTLLDCDELMNRGRISGCNKILKDSNSLHCLTGN